MAWKIEIEIENVGEQRGNKERVRAHKIIDDNVWMLIFANRSVKCFTLLLVKPVINDIVIKNE